MFPWGENLDVIGCWLPCWFGTFLLWYQVYVQFLSFLVYIGHAIQLVDQSNTWTNVDCVHFSVWQLFCVGVGGILSWCHKTLNPSTWSSFVFVSDISSFYLDVVNFYLLHIKGYRNNIMFSETLCFRKPPICHRNNYFLDAQKHVFRTPFVFGNPYFLPK